MNIKRFKLFGWIITNDSKYEWAINNPPKYIFKIPLLPILFIKWRKRGVVMKLSFNNKVGIVITVINIIMLILLKYAI